MIRVQSGTEMHRWLCVYTSLVHLQVWHLASILGDTFPLVLSQNYPWKMYLGILVDFDPWKDHLKRMRYRLNLSRPQRPTNHAQTPSEVPIVPGLLSHLLQCEMIDGKASGQTNTY